MLRKGDRVKTSEFSAKRGTVIRRGMSKDSALRTVPVLWDCGTRTVCFESSLVKIEERVPGYKIGDRVTWDYQNEAFLCGVVAMVRQYDADSTPEYTIVWDNGVRSTRRENEIHLVVAASDAVFQPGSRIRFRGADGSIRCGRIVHSTIPLKGQQCCVVLWDDGTLSEPYAHFLEAEC
jgi:hypothetical protein